jgi:hypothetical protein
MFQGYEDFNDPRFREEQLGKIAASRLKMKLIHPRQEAAK